MSILWLPIYAHFCHFYGLNLSQAKNWLRNGNDGAKINTWVQAQGNI
jgi:hypothetical protein